MTQASAKITKHTAAISGIIENMATLQRNQVVIYSFNNASVTAAVRAYIVTVAANGTQTLAQVGAGHIDLDTARNAVYGTEWLSRIFREVHVGDPALVGA